MLAKKILPGRDLFVLLLDQDQAFDIYAYASQRVSGPRTKPKFVADLV
jgi:hypothetical protein